MIVNRNTSDNELIAIATGLHDQVQRCIKQIEDLLNAQKDAQEKLRECLIRADERELSLDGIINNQ